MAGQFAPYAPVGVEQTASGYEVAFKNAGTNQFSIWSTDSNGNFVSYTVYSGTSVVLEQLETSFHQDLNGDGAIGVPNGTVIESFGSTGLVQVGSNYFFDPVAGGTGPELKFNGSPVVVGQFNPYVPVGVEQTASGYEVAFKNAGTNQFSIWNADSNGNFLSYAVYSGTSTALESLETGFHQDLNGDGVIGSPIESFGSTSLVQGGSNYFFDPVAGGTGPELKYNGSPVVVGQFDPYVPVGVEQTASGYEVAFKNAGTNQFSIWNTDSNGNFLSYAVYSGTSTALELLETSFHQDLNGDGVIGVSTTVIEASGSTSLVQVGNNYFFDPVAGGTGPELKYNGSPVIAGQFAPYVPVGVEQTASGFEVAFKNAGTNQFSIWNTDSNGNFLSYAVYSGTSTALETLETSFHQELNGAPTLAISNAALTVAAGGSVPLGVQVTPVDADDTVSVTISGLTSYETITNNLDQSVFSGSSVTLSAAEVNSGLTLHSSYAGTGHPVNNLTLAASNTTTGEAGTSAAQTIVVTDPPAIASSSPQSISASNPAIAMPDLKSDGGASPAGLSPPAYTTLAGLLDQYMAAGSGQGAPGVVRTAWTDSQQALLGGDQGLLTRPHG